MTVHYRSYLDNSSDAEVMPSESERWHAFQCLLPPRPAVADAFLTRGISPLLHGLQTTGELSAWSFTRQSPREVCLHLLGSAPRLLAARLAGLCAAVGAEGPVHVPHLAAPPARDPRLVDVAVDLIGMTPGRQARLGAAVDLAMVAAMRSCPALRGDSELVTSEAALPSVRWQRIATALKTERHPLTCWSHLLEAFRRAPGYESAMTFDLVHLLHNQLGLSTRDEQRVHAGLIRSLSRRRAGARRSPRSHLSVPHPGPVRPKR
ncbi:hypothetical protein MILUP08_43591 [Micromonospora lupini str. Lupac 08]|uniref:Thiopeptide-type bacteriocin biosynthesis domain-containing protein n=1 Tax=Micromonospora lupini str. Lupac 08 TaxID=1150864 RepID=I0L4D3_9ACTN|nr:hypothetical protein MILUP08_43591 [Micromonospora lupini str. Lupac 08]